MDQFFNEIRKAVHQLELFMLNSSVNLVIFENSKLKTLNTLNGKGAAIRAKVDDKLGQAIVSDFRNPSDIATHIRKLALLGDSAEFSFSDAKTFPEMVLIHDTVKNKRIENIVEDGQKAVELIKERVPGVNVEFIGERTLEDVRIMTSRGADAAYQRMFYSYGIMGEIIENQNILRVAKYSKGIKKPVSVETMADELSQNLIVGRKTVAFKPGKMTVLFAPAALSDVLMAFTEAIDGDMVAKGVSPLCQSIGITILNPQLTILDDPWNTDGIMAAPFDDEGTPTSTKSIVEKGVLKNFLTDRKSAAILNQPPSGNGYRAVPFERYKSFSVGVSTEFSNLVVNAGDTPLDQLRQDIDLGVEIHQINGILLGDLIGGDFSGSLEVAFLIKNGERVGRVKNAMIGGNFYRLFKNQLVALSAEREWTGTFGGCSGALLLPYMRVDGVDISGTD
ncbi:TldD/PmbA family protein [bacterium]|nr:TldD/PmbA family protein [candidate division CSSED10-310 bacterium]